MSVGFRFQTRDYTVETPCQFEQCLVGDWENWAARANQYLMVLEERAGGDAARLALVASFREQYDRTLAVDCSRLAAFWPSLREACQDGVIVFVGIAQAAEAAAAGWGLPITVGDGEGFTLAYDWGGRRPHLPRPGGDPPPVVPPWQTHPPGGIIPGAGSLFELFGNIGPAVLVVIGLWLLASMDRKRGS